MPPRDSLGRLLNLATAAANTRANDMLAVHGLTLGHWVLLSALWRSDGLLVSELAEYSGNNVPAASRMVDRMVEAGLVERRGDDNDRRAVRVFLTGHAKTMSSLCGFYHSVNEVLMAGFSPQERKQLLDLLARVAANARG